MPRRSKKVSFELWQDGCVVASVEAYDRDLAEREIEHYALIYSQDGPVEIKERK